MTNKLILVCPFSCMEKFARKHLGDDVFFISAAAAVFQLDDCENVKILKALIEREKITELIILNDTSCRFINKVLKGDNHLYLPVESMLLKMFKDNYSEIMENKLLSEQQEMLAMLNVKRQAKEMLNSTLFRHNSSNEIKLTGMVTTKSANRIQTIKSCY